MSNKYLIATVVEIALGIGFVVAGLSGLVDGFWSGAGSGLLGVGIAQLIRLIRYNTNAEYKESYDTEAKDERNRFLAMKAWSWAGYLFVLIAGVGTFGFKIAGKEDLMMACGLGVCLILILYCISYFVLKRKY